MLGELDLIEPEETGTTFIENAELKAKLAAATAELPALSDDSGFCVQALAGHLVYILPAGRARQGFRTRYGTC